MRGNELLQGLLGFGVFYAWISVALGAAWLLAQIFHKHAAMRHLIRLTALMVLLAIPVLAHVSQAQYRLPVPIPASAIRAARLFMAPLSPPSVAEPRSLLLHKTRHGSNTAHSSTPITKWRLLLIACIAIWTSGVVWFAFRLLLAFFGVRQIYHNSEAGHLTAGNRFDLNLHFSMKRVWDLRVSTASTPNTAMTWGFIKPVVLLPSEALQWSEGRHRVVLSHELAHVQRGDSLTGILAYLVCALYWFHPAVWLTARAMREDAEGAADDAVLESGVKPSAYANELMQIASEADVQAVRNGLISVSFLRESKIATRIGAIVDKNNRRESLSLRRIQILICLTVLLVLIAVATRPSVSVSIRSDQTFTSDI